LEEKKMKKLKDFRIKQKIIIKIDRDDKNLGFLISKTLYLYKEN